MKRLFSLDWRWALGIVALLDVVMVGLGMGVPFFNIMLGFPIGWYGARRGLEHREHSRVLPEIFLWSMGGAFATFVLMLLVWGRMALLLWQPDVDFFQLGMPLILYEPRPSFIAWLVLMIVISPTLQLLTAIFEGFLTLMTRGWPGKSSTSPGPTRKKKRRK